jgi:hypothetical protein
LEVWNAIRPVRSMQWQPFALHCSCYTPGAENVFFFHTKRQFGTSTWITWGLMAWCCKSAEECRDSTSRCLNPIDFFQVSELFVSAQCWPHRPHIYSMYSQYVSYWVIFPLFGFGSRVTVTAPRKQTVCVCY